MDEPRERRRGTGGSRTHTTLVLGGLVVLAVCAAVIGGSDVAARHASQAAPAANNPPWLIKNPALAGKVLHLTEHTFIWSPGTVDPANGKLVIGDVWMQLNSSGDPIFFHGRWTYPDGTFHQEIYATTQEYIVVRGNDYAASAPPPGPPGYPRPSSWCVSKQPTTPRLLADATPQFVNEAALPAAGYTKSQGTLDRSVPSTPSLPSVSAVDVYHVPAVAHQWKHRITLPSGNVFTTTISVDTRGRMLLWESHYTDVHNQSLGSDTWFAFGDLLVYLSLAGVPQSVLSVPPQVTKGCNY